ncbi:MAG: hypothetical protein MRY21_04135 [Simkaniaceae bacterium]|nr:hypothetical protein [Simkaniaceae bacterium]
MIEIATKNKIKLSDYDYKRDVKIRMILSNLDDTDIEVLEEILYNPPTFTLQSLARNLELPTEKLMASMDKLKETELFTIDGDTVSVNKEMRRLFESLIEVFEEDYMPGMDHLQALLKKVPIHVLPTWYHIPRTSNNIFDSLVEKYLETPQTFQRYMMELNFGEEVLSKIIEDVFASPELKVPSYDLMQKYQLDNESYEELLLQLEFNFVLTVKYEKIEGHWIEFVVPFKEWRDYLLFLRSTEPSPIIESQSIELFRPHEYAFTEDMAALIKVCKMRDLSVVYNKDADCWTPDSEHLALIADAMQEYDLGNQIHKDQLKNYLPRLIAKLCQIHMAEVRDNHLIPTDEANEWIHLPSEKRALETYKHPLNSPRISGVSTSLSSDRNLREVEKSIHRVVNSGWVYYEEFLRGMIVPLDEETKTKLKKVGRSWKYTVPSYSDEQKSFIYSTIMSWLFESGIVRVGQHKGRDCFAATELGKSLFG